MQALTWRGTIADMLCGEFRRATEMFFASVIAPSCATITALEAAPEGDDDPSVMEPYHRARNAREARKALALSLAGLWESHFREQMRKSVAIILKDKKVADRVETCALKDLEGIFAKMRGFELESLRTFPKIRALVLVANAARHGNGPSSGAVYKQYPEYFSDQKPFAGWYSYVLQGAAPKDDVRYIHITDAHLAEFHEAIMSFWDDIAALSRKAEP